MELSFSWFAFFCFLIYLIIFFATAMSDNSKDCRVCSDKANAAKQPPTPATPPPPPTGTFANEQTSTNESGSKGGDRPPTASAATPAAAATTPLYAYMHSGCPLNRREVGRTAWAFLHTTAAYYPNQPSREMQNTMEQFMLSMARVYPCGCVRRSHADVACRFFECFACTEVDCGFVGPGAWLVGWLVGVFWGFF
jgi:hypothetical protein